MTKKICPECGAEQEIFAKFCKNCGSQLSDENKNDNVMKCSYCGTELSDEAFCPDCGKSTGIKICPNCRQKTVNEDYCSVCGYKINKNIKICANCGNKIDARAKVCAHCGANVAGKNPVVALILYLFSPVWVNCIIIRTKKDSLSLLHILCHGYWLYCLLE